MNRARLHEHPKVFLLPDTDTNSLLLLFPVLEPAPEGLQDGRLHSIHLVYSLGVWIQALEPQQLLVIGPHQLVMGSSQWISRNTPYCGLEVMLGGEGVASSCTPVLPSSQACHCHPLALHCTQIRANTPPSTFPDPCHMAWPRLHCWGALFGIRH